LIAGNSASKAKKRKCWDKGYKNEDQKQFGLICAGS